MQFKVNNLLALIKRKDKYFIIPVRKLIGFKALWLAQTPDSLGTIMYKTKHNKTKSCTIMEFHGKSYINLIFMQTLL